MSKSLTKKNIFREDPKQYKEEQDKYFGGLGQPRVPGASADDKEFHERALPSEERAQKKLEYYTKGFQKTSRSGAFAKSGLSPAIFPSGLKFASDFIDKEITPGFNKLPKKPDKQTFDQTKRIDVPKAAVIITDRCMDCMNLVDPKESWINLFFVTEQDSLKLSALGLKFGDPVMDLLCNKCEQEKKQYRYQSMPLVFKGELFTDKEMQTIRKWSPQLGIHSGTQIRLGEWKLIKRVEHIWDNTAQYIINHRLRGDDSIFRNDRKTRPDPKIELSSR